MCVLLCPVGKLRHTSYYSRGGKNNGVESEFNANPSCLILTEKQQLEQHNKIWAFYCDDTELI